jgi:uncharacterized protein (TIGR03435 family)
MFQFHGPGVLMVRNIGMGDFATSLGITVMDRPVVDQTGLAGKFDLTLDSPPDLFTAFQRQPGLKLN